MSYNATKYLFFVFFALVKKRIFFFSLLSTTQSGTRPQKSSCLWQEVPAVVLSVTSGPSHSVS